jgi:hypothetical protein
MQMMRMQTSQEKVHILFFYKNNKYILEKKMNGYSSILACTISPEGDAG